MVKSKSYIYEKLIIALLFWLILQDFVLSIFYNLTGSSILTKILFYSKDIALVFLFLWSLSRGISKKLFIGLLVFLVSVFISMLLAIAGSQITFLSLLQNVRNIILLPCFICIGYAIRQRDYFINKCKKRFFAFIVFCAVIGIVDYYLDKLVGTVNFWRNTVGITDFLIDIKGQGVRLVEGLPGNFYGQYGNEFFSVKRLVSIWMNPLTAAYLMALPFVYFSISFIKYKSNSHLIKALILGFAIYLTHTRAIIIILLLLFVLYLILNPSTNNTILLFLIVIAGLAAAILFVNKIYSILYDGSTMGHINAIVESLNNIGLSLFGAGFGRIGISGDVGSESQYLTVVGNLGVLGLAVYLFFLIFPLVRINKISKKDILDKTVLYLGFGYILTGIISEQLSAYTTIVPYFILLGFTLKQSISKPRKMTVSRTTDKFAEKSSLKSI